MIRLAVRAPSEAAEEVLAALLELAPGGVEEVDGDGFVEYAVYGAPGELPALTEGRAEVGGVPVEVSGREVAEDWTERWKRFHVPVLIAGRLYVRPPWEGAAVRPGVEEIVIDPGQAFGTGAHPTTRMCLELLLALDAHGSFADLGCGSGTLAIAASKLGFEPVLAVDFDRGAVDATAANAAANGVTLEKVARMDLRTEPPPDATTAAANLTAPLLRSMAGRLGDNLEVVIVSGVLEEEWPQVRESFGRLAVTRLLTGGGWAAALLMR